MNKLYVDTALKAQVKNVECIEYHEVKGFKMFIVITRWPFLTTVSIPLPLVMKLFHNLYSSLDSDSLSLMADLTISA